MTRRLAGAALPLLLLLAGLAAAAPVRAGGWDRFEIIMWHDHGPAALAGARSLGVTAGLIYGVREDLSPAAVAAQLAARAAPMRAAGLGFYVENIATDFYAAYHRWRPDHPVSWLFDLAQARRRSDPSDPSVFVRDPGLSDPVWLARIASRLQAHVRALGSAPLFYDLGDETGIADLTAAWDFDIAPASLAGMRDWLRGQYPSLAALNAEWGTGFATWDAVRPTLTDAALAVQDGNFAAWADFRAWMDVAFARALRAGTEAVHAADPQARAGLEGAQMPGTGGYDYTLLAGAVDVMEVTGAGEAEEIAQALNPALITLISRSGAGSGARHDMWRAAVAGGGGVILWDPDAGIVRPDGTPGPFGRVLAPLFAELGGPLGATLRAARPETDPVAILYSPASARTGWILDRQAAAATGQDWSQRRSETELADNPLRLAVRRTRAALAHLGLQPRWLSPQMLAAGALGRDGLRALLLPHTLALSEAELAAIRAFAQAGGTVIADVPPGAYDGHSRRRVAPPDGIAALIPDLSPATLGPALAAAGVVPRFTLARPDGMPVVDATVRVRRDGERLILAVQRDPPPAGGGADAPTDPPAPVVLRLDRPLWLHDLRGADPARLTDRLTLDLDAAEPALFAAAGHP